MIINHPLLGPRDSAESTYLGDASLINRPDWNLLMPYKTSQSMAICATTLLECIVNYGFMKAEIDPGLS